MTAQDIKKITIIGCGMIGPDISTSVLTAGISVRLVGLDENDTARGVENIGKDLDDLVAEGVITGTEKKEALGRVTTSTNIADAVKDAVLGVGAGFEDREAEQALFSPYDAH